MTLGSKLNPVRFIIIGDFGKDLDDEDTLVLHDGERRKRELAFFSTQGSRRQDLFELNAVIGNLAPARQRARLAKGTLKKLGRPNVPVGVGTSCGLPETGHAHEFDKVTYMADDSEVEDGPSLLIRQLEGAEDQSITLILISGMTDVAALLRSHPELVSSKVKYVAIMGGIIQENDSPKLCAEGFLQPDDAANNKFDMESAKYTYRRIQELNIPMVILTREAAYACQVPRSFYDELADTGHEVGIKLRDTQQGSLEALWKRCCLPAGDAARAGLPDSRDKKWFTTVFCAGKGIELTAEDSIWHLVTGFMLYDPLTLIAAVPEFREKFFDPTVVKIHETEHYIIGVSKAKPGVKDGKALADFMLKRCLISLTISLAERCWSQRDERAETRADAPPVPPPQVEASEAASTDAAASPSA